ncbi:L,D-transpeptidase family protein [Streptomyces monticola]|uniref:L,D-transpeptidase family protein n=1 Tax=Streptomyces monticola TaxID=2666263 RepID=A0ABW2JP57_9ACTN
MRRTFGIRGAAGIRRAVGIRRVPGTRRALVAAAAVVLAAGCTVQATGTGPARQPAQQPGKGAGESAGEGAGKSPSPDGKPSSGASSNPSSNAGALVLMPGEKGTKVRELQARLRQIGWFPQYPNGRYDDTTVKAVKGFQGKRGLPRTGETDTGTWQRLLGMTGKPGYFDLYAGGDQPPAKPDARCLTGRVLCISKKSRTLSWMVDGKRVSTVDVRFGSQYTPTREGVFSVYWKSRHHVSTLYDTPMPYAMFFSGGQAVHYSSDFAARGYSGTSHGCVNVRDEGKIAALFGQVRKGDKVVVYW